MKKSKLIPAIILGITNIFPVAAFSTSISHPSLKDDNCIYIGNSNELSRKDATQIAKSHRKNLSLTFPIDKKGKISGATSYYVCDK